MFRDGFGLWVVELCSELFFLFLLSVDGVLLCLETFNGTTEATGVGDLLDGALLVTELECSRLNSTVKSASWRGIVLAADRRGKEP